MRSFGWVVCSRETAWSVRRCRGSAWSTAPYACLHVRRRWLALAQVLLPFMLLSLYGVIRTSIRSWSAPPRTSAPIPFKRGAPDHAAARRARHPVERAADLRSGDQRIRDTEPGGGARVQLMSTTIYEQMTELADWPFASAISFILLVVVLAISSCGRGSTRRDGARPMMRVLGLLALVIFLYLLGPIVVIVGSALGETSYLAFPPHGSR